MTTQYSIDNGASWHAATPGLAVNIPEGQEIIYRPLARQVQRLTVQELMALYDHGKGDWCRIARGVEERYASELEATRAALAKALLPADSTSPGAPVATKTSFEDYWWEARHKGGTPYGYAKDAWDFVLKSVATIQEPVMVAEPRAVYIQDQTVAGFLAQRCRAIVANNTATQKACEDRIIAHLVVKYSTVPVAAPMVADPAGVPFDQEEFIRQVSVSVAEMDRDSPEGQPEMMLVTPDELQNTMRSVFDRFDDAAATVKAIPSVALDEPNMLWLSDDNEVFANGPDDFATDYADNLSACEETEVSVDCAYRGQKRTIRISVLLVDGDRKVVWQWVTPLADKTGEGE